MKLAVRVLVDSIGLLAVWAIPIAILFLASQR